jgi:fructose/tagatose bisphosphate aldolase
VDVPVVVHLDHGYTYDECREALDSGFTSLMFDGSRKPLAENIAETRADRDMAHAAGISCEGEIGFVGYSGARPRRERTRNGSRRSFRPRKRCGRHGDLGRQRAPAAGSRGRAG